MFKQLKRIKLKISSSIIKIINHQLINTNWIYLLILVTSLVCAYTYNDYLILLINLPLIKYLIDFKFNYKICLLLVSTIAIVISLCILIPYNTTLKTIITNHNKLYPNNLKLLIINYIKNHYPNYNTQSFILLLLFNIKSNYGFRIELYHLNLAHLFVVSGLHLSCFVWIINKVFKQKHLFLQTIILFSIIGFYSYLLDFSTSCIRVLIGLLFRFPTFKKINRIDLLAINGLICALINIYGLKTLSFIFSYGCVMILNILNQRLKISKLAKSIVISLCVFSFTTPISISLNNQINILGLVYGYIFFLPIIGIYHLFFWSIFIPHFDIVADWICNQFIFIIKKIADIDVAILFNDINKLYIIIYFVFYISSLLIYYKWNY